MSIEAMKQALEALDSKHDMTKAEWRVLQYRAFNALRVAITEASMQRLTDVQQAIETAVADQATCGMGITLGGKRIDPASIYKDLANCVYKATTKAGETAHFGVLSAAKAWAKSGTVEVVLLKNLKLVQKPCSTCEALSRTVMLDQTYHDAVSREREWVGLTDEEMMVAAYQAGFDIHEDYDNEDDPKEMHWWTPDGEVCDDSLLKLRDIIEAKLKEKNT